MSREVYRLYHAIHRAQVRVLSSRALGLLLAEYVRMSNRRLVTFLVVGLTALIVGSGCATETGDEENGGENSTAATETDNSVQVSADTDSLDTQGSGTNCACPAGKVYQNGLCYTPCAGGYTGEGPVCWQNCAAGFTDTGWFCQRNSKVIGADTSRCPWYNKCGVNSDCNKCPAGYANDGCTCRLDAYIYAQPSYGRGAGTTPTCTAY